MATEEHNDNNGSREEEFIPEWRRRIERKREIVREYMHTVEDDKLFLVAFLLMRGIEDKTIAKTLSMTEEEVAAAKGRIAIGLRLKGIEVRK